MKINGVDKYISTADIASTLSISRRQAQRIVNMFEGSGDVIRPGKKKMLVKESAFRSWMRELEAENRGTYRNARHIGEA